MQALAARAQLGDGLRAAQEQHGEHRLLVGRDGQRLVEQVAVLRRAAARRARVPRPAPAAQALERVAQHRLVVVHDRVAVRRLVAREAQRVERQRVLVGRRALLLEQGAEDALFGCRQVHGRQPTHPADVRCAYAGSGMAQDPTTDRTTIASWSEELLDTTLDRVSLRERLLRMRRMAPRVAMVAVAAATAYVIARYAVGHPRPFFAPIATVIVLGITLGQRTRRAIQLAVGVALGVLVADLVVQLIGTGAWQIAVIVFVGMMAVVFLGGDQLVVVQAANAGVLIAVLAIPGDPTGLSRFDRRADRRGHRARLQPRALPGRTR